MIDKETFEQLYIHYRPQLDKELMWGLIKVLNKEVNPKNILEIGLRYGGTTRVWMDYCEFNKGRLIGVDLNVIPPRCMTSFCKAPAYFVQGDSTGKKTVDYVQRLIDETEEKEFDFIFINSVNSLETVYEDIKNYYSMLRQGGLIAIFNNSNHNKINGIDLAIGKNHVSDARWNMICNTELFKKYFDGILYKIKE